MAVLGHWEMAARQDLAAGLPVPGSQPYGHGVRRWRQRPYKVGCARRCHRSSLAQPSHDQADQDQQPRHGQNTEPEPAGLTGSRAAAGTGGTGHHRARNGSGETPSTASHVGPAVVACRRRPCATDRHDHSVSQLPRLARFAGWTACAAPWLPHQNHSADAALWLMSFPSKTWHLAGGRGRTEVCGPKLPGLVQHHGGVLSRT